MDVSYGNGRFQEGDKKHEGQIILSEHKLFLKKPEGDIAQTYIPLEKIEKLKKTIQGLTLQVRPSLAYRYHVVLSGEKKNIEALVKDLVGRRGFKKLFLKNEWVEDAA